jgi:hypothetical protein
METIDMKSDARVTSANQVTKFLAKQSICKKVESKTIENNQKQSSYFQVLCVA